MTIGERIKQRRLELGLTVEQVAKSLDKNRATVYRYECDYIYQLPITVLEPLAKVLQCTPAYLMGWEDYPFQLKELAEKEIEKRKSISPIETLNIRLKRAIESKNTNIFELSQKTGISEKTLNSYLSGRTQPCEDDIYLISKALEIAQDWLTGYDVPMDAKYYSKDYKLSAEEECIITMFRNLNKSGQDRLLEYSMELIEITKYKLKKSDIN